MTYFDRFTEIGNHLSKHGDGAKDIAFEVEDLDAIFKVINPDYILRGKLQTVYFLVCRLWRCWR